MSQEDVIASNLESEVPVAEESGMESEVHEHSGSVESADVNMEEEHDEPQYTLESPRRSHRVVPVKKEVEIDYSAPKRGAKRGSSASSRKSSTSPSKKAKKQPEPVAEVIPPTAAINWVACGIPSCGKWRIVTPDQFVHYSSPKAKVTCSLIGTSCETEDDEARFPTLEAQTVHLTEMFNAIPVKEEKKVVLSQVAVGMVVAESEASHNEQPETVTAPEAHISQETPVEEPTIEEPRIEEPTIEEPTIEEPTPEEPIVADESPVEEPIPSLESAPQEEEDDATLDETPAPAFNFSSFNIPQASSFTSPFAPQPPTME
jgi:hypothetical protein